MKVLFGPPEEWPIREELHLNDNFLLSSLIFRDRPFPDLLKPDVLILVIQPENA